MTSLSWQIFAAVQVITRLQRQVCEIALNQRAAHTRHLLEIVKGFERTVLLAVANNGLGFFKSHTVHHARELFCRCRIDADSRTVILCTFTGISRF